MTDPIRLVLVDDHRMFRSGVKAELDASMDDRRARPPTSTRAVA